MNLYNTIRELAGKMVTEQKNVVVGKSSEGFTVKIQRRDGGRGRNLGSVTMVWSAEGNKMRKADWKAIVDHQWRAGAA